jgi:hypothetical protein
MSSAITTAWRRGVEPTYADAKRVIAARFRQWVEESGNPKPYRYRSLYDIAISEPPAGRRPVWPPQDPCRQE